MGLQEIPAYTEDRRNAFLRDQEALITKIQRVFKLSEKDIVANPIYRDSQAKAIGARIDDPDWKTRCKDACGERYTPALQRKMDGVVRGHMQSYANAFYLRKAVFDAPAPEEPRYRFYADQTKRAPLLDLLISHITREAISELRATAQSGELETVKLANYMIRNIAEVNQVFEPARSTLSHVNPQLNNKITTPKQARERIHKIFTYAGNERADHDRAYRIGQLAALCGVAHAELTAPKNVRESIIDRIDAFLESGGGKSLVLRAMQASHLATEDIHENALCLVAHDIAQDFARVLTAHDALATHEAAHCDLHLLIRQMTRESFARLEALGFNPPSATLVMTGIVRATAEEYAHALPESGAGQQFTRTIASGELSALQTKKDMLGYMENTLSLAHARPRGRSPSDYVTAEVNLRRLLEKRFQLSPEKLVMPDTMRVAVDSLMAQFIDAADSPWRKKCEECAAASHVTLTGEQQSALDEMARTAMRRYAQGFYIRTQVDDLPTPRHVRGPSRNYFLPAFNRNDLLVNQTACDALDVLQTLPLSKQDMLKLKGFLITNIVNLYREIDPGHKDAAYVEPGVQRAATEDYAAHAIRRVYEYGDELRRAIAQEMGSSAGAKPSR